MPGQQPPTPGNDPSGDSAGDRQKFGSAGGCLGCLGSLILGIVALGAVKAGLDEVNRYASAGAGTSSAGWTFVVLGALLAVLAIALLVYAGRESNRKRPG